MKSTTPDAHAVLLAPVVSEKSYSLTEDGKYTFHVHPDAHKTQVRQAVALQEKTRQDLELSKRSAALSARQSFLGVTNGMAQVRALEAALVSSQSALDSNKLGYEVGVRINIDVLNAQQQLFSTKRDLSKARYDTLVNGLKLKAAAGSLSEEDVAAVNRLLGE